MNIYYYIVNRYRRKKGKVIKMTTIFKMLKAGYLMGKAINLVAKKRGNPMAAVSLVWGSIFSDGLQFNWGLRFVPKSVMEGKEGG